MKTEKSRFALALAAMFSSALLVVGCMASPEEAMDAPEITELAPGNGKGPKICAIKCAAPPEGCHYEGTVSSGPCHKVTCGELVCVDICSILCAAPPEGCHYEGALGTGPCDQVTCGTLVCDGSTL